MGLFNRRKNNAEQRSLTFAQIFGLNNNAVQVSEEGAISRSMAVSRAVAVTAGAIASLPLKAYRTTPAGREEIRSPILSDPSPTYTQYEWVETIASHLLGWGDVFLAIEKNGAGVPVFLHPVLPWRVTVRRITDGTKLFDVTTDDGQQRTFTEKDILHIPGLSTDGLSGHGPVGVARIAASAGIAAEKYALKLWESGALHSGILTTEGELTEEAAKALKEKFAQRQGITNAHEPIVLDTKTTYTPVALKPADAEWIEGRRFETRQIYELFGLNEHGVPEHAHDFLKWTLLPYLKRIEQRLTRLLPKNQHAEFSTAGLERADIQHRWASYAIGMQNGFITVKEVREWENLSTDEAVLAELKPLGPGVGTPNARIDSNRED